MSLPYEPGCCPDCGSCLWDNSTLTCHSCDQPKAPELPIMSREELLHHRCIREQSWTLHDAKGIPLSTVCDDCEEARRATYRRCILEGYTQADVDEPIEEEEGVPGW